MKLSSDFLVCRELCSLNRAGGAIPESIVTPMTLLFLSLIIIASAVRTFLLIVSSRYIYALGSDITISMYRGILEQRDQCYVSNHSSELITRANKVNKTVFTTRQ